MRLLLSKVIGVNFNNMNINSTRIDGETIWSNITYTLSDGSEVTTDVAVFQPQTSGDVLTALSNREVSEQAKIDAEVTNKAIKDELDEQVNQPIEINNGKIIVKNIK